MRRIGIFGGTFNPPHIAHSIAAEVLREQLELEKIIFIPAAVPPLKETGSPLHRLTMTHLAFGRNEHFEVSEIEFENVNEKSYTVDTLSRLRIELGIDCKLFLIIGIDKLEELPRWKEPDKLLGLCEPVVINRPGYDLANVRKEYLEKVTFAKIPFMEISSTEIRKRVSEGKSIKYFVCREVEEYIRENKLYETI